MTERNDTRDRLRFEELLAFHANNSLDGTDRQWLADYLASHPEMTSLLAVEERLRTVVRTTASPVPEAVRLERLLTEFRALAHRPSFWRQIVEWFANAHRVPASAIVAAAVLLVLQGTVLFQTLPRQMAETDLYRDAKVPCEDGPSIRIVFRPEAPQAEVVILLRKVEAVVSDGPTETGQWWVRIPKGRPVAEALGQLQASTLVDEAILFESHGKGCP